MRLFHGSTVTVKRPNIQKGRKATDFGKGFYTTTNFEQAKKWALLKKNREQSEKAIVSVYEVPDDILDLKSATKLFSVLLASKRPLITELADKLRLKYPLLPTISPCPTMRLEAIRSIIPISCRRYPKSV